MDKLLAPSYLSNTHAKDGSMTDETATEAKRVELPKRIAGMKLPKKFRRTVEALIAEANTPVARELLATALVALAAVVRGGGAKPAGDAKASGWTLPSATTDRIGPMIDLAAGALGQWLGDAKPMAAATPPGDDASKPKPH